MVLLIIKQNLVTKSTKKIKWNRSYYRNISEDEIIKIRNYAKIKNKNIRHGSRKRKEYMKNYYHKRKKLLNHFISLIVLNN